jgi:hypothetical protein
MGARKTRNPQGDTKATAILDVVAFLAEECSLLGLPSPRKEPLHFWVDSFCPAFAEAWPAHPNPHANPHAREHARLAVIAAINGDAAKAKRELRSVLVVLLGQAPPSPP